VSRTAAHPVVVACARADAPQALRRRYLKAHLPPEASVFPTDADPATVHVVVTVAGRPVAAVSLVPEPWPTGTGEPPPPPGFDAVDAAAAGLWRLRGMITVPEARGRGYGTTALAEALARADARGGTGIWLNARTEAVAFYARAGFAPVRCDAGRVGDDGRPRHRMVRRLGVAPPSR